MLACILLTGVAFAQYRFDSWTADNGLPQNSVQAIRQTRDGYLWLATPICQKLNLHGSHALMKFALRRHSELL